MNPIAVTIVMPSFNVAAYIEECIKSVCNQTLNNIEIICIDAGSNDGTCNILQKYASMDNRVQLIHSEKKSYGYQVNTGIHMARGEYIAIVETDDFIQPNMYEILFSYAKKYNVDIVKGNYRTYWTQNNGERVFRDRKNLSDKSLYNVIIEPRKECEIATGDWYLWTGIYRKAFLLEENILLSETPGAAFQDIGFLYKTNSRAKTSYYVKDFLYNYCIDRDQASSNSGKELEYSYYEFCKIVEELGDDVKDYSLYARMAKSFTSSCRRVNAENMSDPTFGMQYNWFLKQLSHALKQGILEKKHMASGIWKRLELLLQGLDIVYQFTEENRLRINRTIGCPGEKLIVIFGCGDRGQDAYKWLVKKAYRVVAFMDNDARLWGTQINSIPVIEPGNYCESEAEIIYIVANEAFYLEISEQLFQMGIEKNKVCIYW